MPVYLRRRASLTRPTLSGSAAAMARAGSARSPAWIVTAGLAIASRYQRAVAPLTERTNASSPSTTIQMIVRWAAPSGRAVSISISSVVVEQGELAGFETHGVSVAHLAREPTVTARFWLSSGCDATVTDAMRLQRVLQTTAATVPPIGRCSRSADARADDVPGRVRHHVIDQEVTVSTQPLVLVADDEPRITKLVSIALGEEGFRVVTATAARRRWPRPRRSARTSSCSTSSCPTSTASRSCASSASAARSR